MGKTFFSGDRRRDLSPGQEFPDVTVSFPGSFGQKFPGPWQELMQVALSIPAGTISSPTLLRKFNYGGPRNKLFLAAHKRGRAGRTIFLLK